MTVPSLLQNARRHGAGLEIIQRIQRKSILRKKFREKENFRPLLPQQIFEELLREKGKREKDRIKNETEKERAEAEAQIMEEIRQYDLEMEKKEKKDRKKKK